MAIVVVGGHSRNIGKTSVVAGLISGLREMQWTAMKITQFGHGVCSANGAPCGCETADHTMAISEERHGVDGAPGRATDSARYLTAGARRSLWVRTRQGQLVAAMPRIRKELALAPNTLVESNSILRFLKPDLYLSVLDPGVKDFKVSARRYLDRADAILVPAGADLGDAMWQHVSEALYRAVPMLSLEPPAYVTQELLAFVRNLLEADRPEPAETSELSGATFP